MFIVEMTEENKRSQGSTGILSYWDFLSRTDLSVNCIVYISNPVSDLDTSTTDLLCLEGWTSLPCESDPFCPETERRPPCIRLLYVHGGPEWYRWIDLRVLVSVIRVSFHTRSTISLGHRSWMLKSNICLVRT